MKKITLLTCSLLALFACDKKDEQQTFNEYEGKWMPIEIQQISEGGEISVSEHESCGEDFLKLNPFLSYELVQHKKIVEFNTETNRPDTICDKKITYGSYKLIDDNIKFIGENAPKEGKVSIKNNELYISRVVSENEQKIEEITKYKKINE